MTTNRLRDLLTNIVLNASLQPDARMGGTADTYAVPLDDIDAARSALGIKPSNTPPIKNSPLEISSMLKLIAPEQARDPEAIRALVKTRWPTGTLRSPE